MLRRINVPAERIHGQGAQGRFLLNDSVLAIPELLKQYAGTVQMIYIDPPFLTGQKFKMRMRVGERDWRGNNGSLDLMAYEDDIEQDNYLQMMREVLTAARELLSPSGVMFLHIDYRMHAKLRLMMDEVFGEQNLLNEIIWTYQTGGRARRYFSRKHDVILFYRKTRRYYFDIGAVAVDRPTNRRNHMKRHVDTDGRIYRSIRSGGKIYTYYDDEPVFPGDVWDDVSHMQQKDPQRTGYDTQKPIDLLNRIVRCSTKPGDLVMDLFAGSGTTLEAAWVNGRGFVGVDKSPMSLHTVRKRLKDANLTIEAPPCAGDPIVEASIEPGVGYYEITLLKYEFESGVSARAMASLDALDGWAAGYIRSGEFVNMAQEMRTKGTPVLKAKLSLPVYDGAPVLRLNDVYGRYFYYSLIQKEQGETP